MNVIRVKVDDVPQAVGQTFMRAPAPNPWNDYQVITWAHYPDGFYDQLRSAGVNATIAYREGDFTQVLNNSFNFYVEQMVWEVYANYHKDLPQWRDVISSVRADRANLDLWIRQPCLNDPKTTEYVRERVQKYVQQHRAFSPLVLHHLGRTRSGRPDQRQRLLPFGILRARVCRVPAQVLRTHPGGASGVGAFRSDSLGRRRHSLRRGLGTRSN